MNSRDPYKGKIGFVFLAISKEVVIPQLFTVTDLIDLCYSFISVDAHINILYLSYLLDLEHLYLCC